ncbi:TetR/AcrR family transcriptional regulator [Mycolicibacterium stellerae]|uniref:TetR/AcrR family transcriptional regulator n=1 Tax=Mycolicibacterium stellerae TaxID=2358193 RepID=UPI000F0BBFD1|nr:TetR/AcrR family transcriptional regulator [Mycolicibacterium stellerae]
MAAAAEPPDVQGLTAKGRATRERILRSAAQVLLSQGLSGFNLERVRTQAAVSGSQLTHYFADKPALIRAVLDRQIEVVMDFHRQPALGGLHTFDDFERWIDLNMRYLRKIGYTKTPTYHTLAGQLVKSDDATRQTLADGYWRWVDLLEQALQRMKDTGVLLTSADPRHLALVVVGGHQGAGTLTFAYRQEWPLADATRFVVNYLRIFAADPAERIARKPRRTRARRTRDSGPPIPESGRRFTRKGLATRARIVRKAADLMFKRGVGGTSLEDVRTTVNVSGSQLSHYFVDKRDLTRQVIALRVNDVVDRHTRPQFGHLDNLQALRAWADACIADAPAVYLRGGCVYGSLVGELLEADEGILDDLAAGYDRWLQLFRDGLAAMRGRGDLVEDADLRHLATALLVAHQGGAMLSHATGTAEPLVALVNAAVDYVAAFRPARSGRASRSMPKAPNKR